MGAHTSSSIRTATRAIVVLAVIAGSMFPTPSKAAVQCLGKTATKVGTNGDDNLKGTKKADVIVGLGGDDTISGLGKGDRLCGGAGDDILFGGGGTDLLSGDEGTDQISGGLGNDTLTGGLGSDYVNYFPSKTPVSVDLGAASATGEGTDKLSTIENVFGSSFDDQIRGDDSTNALVGLGGNDTIDARGALDLIFATAGTVPESLDGDDRIDGGLGLDAVHYGGSPFPLEVNLGTNSASGDGNDQLHDIEGVFGSQFNDKLTGDANRNLLLGGAGNDTMDGGGSGDAVGFWFSSVSGVNANLQTGQATGEGTDTFTNVEGLLGSVAFGDTLIGNDDKNFLDGDGGDDLVRGFGGDDRLVGGLGDDRIEGGDGDYDIVDFSTTAFFEAVQPVDVDLDAATADGQGTDFFDDTVEAVMGSDADDNIVGNDASNKLFGLGGNDSITGGVGDDFLDGGDGVGDSGNGSSGNDHCRNFESSVECEDGTAAAPPPLSDTASDVVAFRRSF